MNWGVPVVSVRFEMFVSEVPPGIEMPFGFAMISAAVLPKISSGPASTEAYCDPVDVTCARIVDAVRPARFGFAPTWPPMSDVPAIGLLLKIRPSGPDESVWNCETESPCAFGAAMLITGAKYITTTMTDAVARIHNE
ncbi:conserved hypothetical protein [Ricinus communis]|uniref:Uncharacterized protein n=1 Tax=Ricinus communis TaxID=3988 RepID=B9THA4_RICCO|nr:conserved hypothetical protein [Ricinus communis]